MPPAPPHRIDGPAIEAALSETWRAAITDTCALLGIPRDRWDAVPGLRTVAEAMALYRRADALRAQHHYGSVRAQLEAGIELGLDPDTVSRRLRAWLRAAFRDGA